MVGLPSYGFLKKSTPIKTDAPHGVPPHLKMKPPYLKNTPPPHWNMKHPSMKWFLEKAQ